MSEVSANTSLKQQTLCFAAICQAVAQVSKLAHTGTWDEEEARIIVRALAISQTEDVNEVYPAEKVKNGLETYIKTFNKQVTNESFEFTRLTFLMLNLGSSIYKQLIKPSKLNIFGNTAHFSKELFIKLDTILDNAKKFGFSPTSDQNIANLAKLYEEEISAVSNSKIKVFGSARFLQQPIVQSRIRALILAGLRAVFLWRQFGGSRRQFIFTRKKMLACAQNYLQQI